MKSEALLVAERVWDFAVTHEGKPCPKCHKPEGNYFSFEEAEKIIAEALAEARRKT